MAMFPIIIRAGRRRVTLYATLTRPMDNVALTFTLGSQQATALTDAQGVASVSFNLKGKNQSATVSGNISGAFVSDSVTCSC